MSYTLKGNSTGRSKIEWPLRLKARVIQFSQQPGTSAKEAFRKAVEEYNAVEGNRPITLPVSYTNVNAGSVLWGIKSRFQKALEKEDAATVEVAKEFGLIDEVKVTPKVTEADLVAAIAADEAETV